jgi:hypothetical protein
MRHRDKNPRCFPQREQFVVSRQEDAFVSWCVSGDAFTSCCKHVLALVESHRLFAAEAHASRTRFGEFGITASWAVVVSPACVAVAVHVFAAIVEFAAGGAVRPAAFCPGRAVAAPSSGVPDPVSAEVSAAPFPGLRIVFPAAADISGRSCYCRFEAERDAATGEDLWDELGPCCRRCAAVRAVRRRDDWPEDCRVRLPAWRERQRGRESPQV